QVFGANRDRVLRESKRSEAQHHRRWRESMVNRAESEPNRTESRRTALFRDDSRLRSAGRFCPPDAASDILAALALLVNGRVAAGSVNPRRLEIARAVGRVDACGQHLAVAHQADGNLRAGIARGPDAAP